MFYLSLSTLYSDTLCLHTLLFLDERMLKDSRYVIERLSLEKRKCFSSAYGYLRAYACVCNNIAELVRPAVNMEKLKKHARRFARELERED